MAVHGSASSLEGCLRACQTLESLGFEHVFGLPGTQTVPLYEALRRSRLNSIVPTSEMAAAFMAGAYYRASGRPAALFTIPGPGFTYALTGLAEARLDSAALLHLTIATPEGPDAAFRLQAIPQRTIAEAVTKGYLVARSTDDVEPTLRAAYRLALQGEPGPVVVALAEHDDVIPRPIEVNVANILPDPGEALSDAWIRLLSARRPLLLAGQGAFACSSALLHLIEQLHVPLLTTPSARGLLPESHQLVMPFDPCREGRQNAADLIDHADFVLILGAKLGHNGSAGRSLPLGSNKVLQIDAEPRNCGSAYPVQSIAATVEAWLAARPAVACGKSEWPLDFLSNTRRSLRTPSAKAAEPTVAGVKPATFFALLRAILPGDSVLVTDTGLHQVLTRRHFDVLSPRGLIMPSDFQSMGFGLPAAIATKLARPDVHVVGIVGDGSFAMNGLELGTAARLQIDLPLFVFDDGKLNQIRWQQWGDYGIDHGTDLWRLDLPALADAVGCRYVDLAGPPDRLADRLAASVSRQGHPTVVRVPVADTIAMTATRARSRVRSSVTAHLPKRLLELLRRASRKPSAR